MEATNCHDMYVANYLYLNTEKTLIAFQAILKTSAVFHLYVIRKQVNILIPNCVRT